MKTVICDFCHTTIIEDNKVMAYEILITAAESYKAESKQEQALLFSAEDVCAACTERVSAALHVLKQELKIERPGSAGSKHATPVGGKSKPPKLQADWNHL